MMPELPLDIVYLIYEQAQEFDGPLKDDPPLTADSKKTILSMRLVSRPFHFAGHSSFVQVLNSRIFALISADMAILKRIALNDQWAGRIRTLRFSSTMHSPLVDKALVEVVRGSSELFRQDPDLRQSLQDLRDFTDRARAYHAARQDLRDFVHLLPVFTGLGALHVYPLEQMALLHKDTRRPTFWWVHLEANKNANAFTLADIVNKHFLKRWLSLAMSLTHHGPKTIVLRREYVHASIVRFEVPASATVTTLVLQQADDPSTVDFRPLLRHCEKAMPALMTVRQQYPALSRPDGFKMEVIYDKSAEGPLVAEVCTLYQTSGWDADSDLFPSAMFGRQLGWVDRNVKELRFNMPFHRTITTAVSIQRYLFKLVMWSQHFWAPLDLKKMYIEEFPLSGSADVEIPSAQLLSRQPLILPYRKYGVKVDPAAFPAERIFIRSVGGEQELVTGRGKKKNREMWFPKRIEIW